MNNLATDREQIDAFQFKIRTDPVWFGEDICHIQFDPWQVEALNAMADPIRKYYNLPTVVNHDCLTKFSIRAMHGPGKTYFAAFALIWFHTAFKGISPVTAPTLKQIKNRLWPNIRKIRGQSNPFLQRFFEVRATEVIWHNDPDWRVIGETGAQPENLQGYHDNFMLIVVDEASGVKEEMFPVIESALSTGIIVLLLLIGNPTKNLGTFADSHLKPAVAKNFYKIHVNLEKTTRVSADWVQTMVDKYGADSPVVKIRCFGDFAEHDEGQLIAFSWLDFARATPFETDGSIPWRRLSIDCADGGDNFTVITMAEHYSSFVRLVRQKQYAFPAGLSTDQTVNAAIEFWNHYSMDARASDDIVVDSLGVGAGVCSGLAHRGYPVVRYIGGAESDNKRLYRNRRVQSFLVNRDRFRDEQLIFNDDFVDEDEWDDLYAQICSVRRKVGIERMEDLLTKQEMVDKGITSPDRADSIAMQFATQSPMMGELIPESIVLGNQMESANHVGALT